MRAKSWTIIATLLASTARPSAAESVAAAPASAVTPQDLALAAGHHSEALKAFEAGRFAAAEIEFAAAYQLSKRFAILHT